MFTADTPIDDINEQVMLSLINLNENNFFDFKQYLFPQDEWNEIASREYLKQVRRSMAAFANSRGGFIFFGVVDKQTAIKKQLTDQDRFCSITLLEGQAAELNKLIHDKYLGCNNEFCEPESIRFESKVLRVNESALVVCKIFPHPSLAFAIRDITKGPLYFYERTGQQSVPMSYNSIWQKISSYQRSVTQKCLLEELNRLMHNIELASKTIKDGKESIISVQKPMFLLTNLHLIGQYEGNDVVRDVLRIDQYISGVNYYLDGLRQLFFIKMSQPEHSNDYKLVIEEGVQQSLESLKDTLNIVLSLFNKIKKIN